VTPEQVSDAFMRLSVELREREVDPKVVIMYSLTTAASIAVATGVDPRVLHLLLDRALDLSTFDVDEEIS
jgi:hypothetical protein